MKSLRIFTAALLGAAALTSIAGIRWLSTTHDFGAFDEDFGPVTTEFRFINDGPVDVNILAARASCGCTTPQYPREAIAPGDTATITVTYNPAGRPGRFSKYVAVDLSDYGRTKLYVKGIVVGDESSVQSRFPIKGTGGMQFQRGALMFGRIEKGQTRSASLNFYNRSTDSITPQVEGLPPYLSLIMEPKTVQPGDQATAIFYFNSGRCPLYGFVNDTLSIVPYPGCEPFVVPSIAIVEEDFSKLSPKELQKAPVASLSETTVDFGKLDSNAKNSRTITLRNEGKSTLTVRRVYSLDEGVEFSIDKTTLKPGKTATITATVDPSKLPGALLNARGSLITNAPAAPTQTIRLVGMF